MNNNQLYNLNDLYRDNLSELEKLNVEMSTLEEAKQRIEHEKDKLLNYIKEGNDSFKFIKYLDINESREVEITGKEQAIFNFNEMDELTNNINNQLLVFEKEKKILFSEIYEMDSRKENEKNELKKKISKANKKPMGKLTEFVVKKLEEKKFMKGNSIPSGILIQILEEAKMKGFTKAKGIQTIRKIANREGWINVYNPSAIQAKK